MPSEHALIDLFDFCNPVANCFIFLRKAEDMISQIVQSRSREMMPMGNGLSGGSPNMNMHNNGSRMSDSLGGSGLPPSIPTVSTPSFTQVRFHFLLIYLNVILEKI